MSSPYSSVEETKKPWLIVWKEETKMSWLVLVWKEETKNNVLASTSLERGTKMSWIVVVWKEKTKMSWLVCRKEHLTTSALS